MESALLKKLYKTTPPILLQHPKVVPVLRAYRDLEAVLRKLKRRADLEESPLSKVIDLKKLIEQLYVSKRRLERKIGNTILLEKEKRQRRWKERKLGKESS